MHCNVVYRGVASLRSMVACIVVPWCIDELIWHFFFRLNVQLLTSSVNSMFLLMAEIVIFITMHPGSGMYDNRLLNYFIILYNFILDMIIYIQTHKLVSFM